VDNKLFSNSDELHPGDFEPGSIESRAAARAVLDDPGRPPIIISEYVEPVFDDAGKHIYGGKVCDSRTASVNGTTIGRGEGESLEEFKERCCRLVPAMQTGIVEMRGDG
jgi:hypothetical protein